ncbi:hypothetical protein [Nissabacter sp. SGAir0207]|uniref:hypothetical protein n=1 Tax=Nissabacter sp. SGAir0207 TaxID=2126321 RepID=UPI0010FA3E56|nr:hypothetical protein [Nissabacter sp. SGAir0207]
MSALTAEEISRIADQAVADVASQKLTTTKSAAPAAYGTAHRDRTAMAHNVNVRYSISDKNVHLSKGNDGITVIYSNDLHGVSSKLSMATGRDLFRTAFNLARKG